MFTLLLTVILVVCIGAVTADLLFGPEQPATTTGSSNRELWDPWSRWLVTSRAAARREAHWFGRHLGTGLRAVGRAAAWLVSNVVVLPLQSVGGAWAGLRARRTALHERRVAHSLHVAHRNELQLLGRADQLPTPPRRRIPRPRLPSRGPRPTSPPTSVPTRPSIPTQPEAPAPADRAASPDAVTLVDAAVPSDEQVTPDDITLVDTAVPSDDITLVDMPAPSDTAVMPPTPVHERPRPSRPWRGLTSRRPAEAPAEAEDVGDEPAEADEPVGAKVSVPLSVPMQSRLRALAILSLLICAFGVVTASVLLVIIVTVSRAVGGI